MGLTEAGSSRFGGGVWRSHCIACVEVTSNEISAQLYCLLCGLCMRQRDPVTIKKLIRNLDRRVHATLLIYVVLTVEDKWIPHLYQSVVPLSR